MIGVIAQDEQSEVVAEFFELFKTPWEHHRPDERYDVVLVGQDDFPAVPIKADVILVFGARTLPVDHDLGVDSSELLRGPVLRFGSRRIPLYGDCVSLRGTGVTLVTEEEGRRPTGVFCDSGPTVVIRVGYDLFSEVRTVLTLGQPPALAHSRTLDMHVALLRQLILTAGVEVVEVPPIPADYKFIACLTHDVDHPRIRLHRFDHTLAGFIYRALVQSLFRALAGRMPTRDLIRNWSAVVRLPLVYVGAARDFWADFVRYPDVEDGIKSTFFVVPFSARPGRKPPGSAPKQRACAYGVSDIAAELRTLIGAGCEVGLHGLDAWIDAESGAEERKAICDVTRASEIGVRMHWLYFDKNSPRALEDAGFGYDSTLGYNETIGFRTGTAQAHKLLGTRALLELPLHIMDTALFRPNYLNLSYSAAEQRIKSMIEGMIDSGGALTLNWHDRSIAPERLWGNFYLRLLENLRANGAWCTGAQNAISWFRRRRSVQFRQTKEGIRITLAEQEQHAGEPIPALRLRVYRPSGQQSSFVDSVCASGAVVQSRQRVRMLVKERSDTGAA